MSIRPEVMPFILAVLILGMLITLLCRRKGMSWLKAIVAGDTFSLVFVGYMLWFFRDPERVPPADPAAIVAAADGVVADIRDVREDQYLKADTVRISIFLSLFDVHVNRAPIAGRSTFLGYFPGKRYFTFQEKSSELNQHNSILIEGSGTRCLVNQIVGPVARRVVYWLDPKQAVGVKSGERIGMMKFGSRLDMYFPKGDISVEVQKGQRVRAGETVVARVRGGGAQ
jgi:phosphatidylserine decarboxylase